MQRAFAQMKINSFPSNFVRRLITRNELDVYTIKSRIRYEERKGHEYVPRCVCLAMHEFCFFPPVGMLLSFKLTPNPHLTPLLPVGGFYCFVACSVPPPLFFRKPWLTIIYWLARSSLALVVKVRDSCAGGIWFEFQPIAWCFQQSEKLNLQFDNTKIIKQK